MANVGATTLGTMTLQAQQRADMVNSAYISPTEWTGMVNASCQQLYDKLIEAYGNDYEVATPYPITTDGIADKYSLPDGNTAPYGAFYKLLGVDLQLSNAGASSTTGWITLRRFNFADRNKYTLPNIQTLWGRTNLQYRLLGNQIWLIPLPMAAMPLRIWYVPRFVPLANSADSFDAINGWEEWVVNDVAMKALAKEESDISAVQALQAVQNERLASIMENRDAGSPATMVDVTGINGGNYGEWGGGDWGP